MDKIYEHEHVNFHYLTYNCKDSKIPPINFSKFTGSLLTFKSIHNGNIPLEDIEKEQGFRSHKAGRPKR